MAKDKSKKKSIDDGFAKPSEAPAGGDGWKLTEGGKDRLLLITPLREEEQKAFGKAGENGEKTKIIVADVVVIDEKDPAKSEEHDEVWIFQRYIQGALRGYIGERRVLGRLRNTEDTTKAKSASGGYYWELEDATEKDTKKAVAYMEALNDPFRKTGGDDDDEPKKGKKSKADKPAAEPEKKSKKGKAEPEPEPAKKKKSKK